MSSKAVIKKIEPNGLWNGLTKYKVTFKNGKINQFLKQISLDHIVLETDAPYLAPVPCRGQRNESSYILNVLEKLSDIYSMSSLEIASITTKNSKSIFKK